jgi:glycine/D-amino acid oxidase-like deaminating enzyme
MRSCEYMASENGLTMGLLACAVAVARCDASVDRLRTRLTVGVAAGLSGHGFTTAPLYGELAAALATEGESPIDMSDFGPN